MGTRERRAERKRRGEREAAAEPHARGYVHPERAPARVACAQQTRVEQARELPHSLVAERRVRAAERRTAQRKRVRCAVVGTQRDDARCLAARPVEVGLLAGLQSTGQSPSTIELLGQ